MERAHRKPWIGIKQEKRNAAKRILIRLCAALIPFLFPAPIAAPADKPGFDRMDTDVFPEPLLDSSVPEIDARAFDVKVVKQSQSLRAYLFQAPNGEKPTVGNIVLLKRDEQPVMAFRVLRTSPERGEFIAKRVRRYASNLSIGQGQSYTALESLQQLGSGAPLDSSEDMQDIRELDGLGNAPSNLTASDDQAAQVPDPGGSAWNREGDDNAVLDSLASDDSPLDDDGSRDAEPDDVESELDDEDFDDAGKRGEFEVDENSEVVERGPSSISVEEIEPLERLRHAVSAEVGFFKGSASTVSADSSPYYSGLGLRYAHTLVRNAFIRRARVQDQLVGEGGFFLYRLANFQVAGDAYTVMPLIFTLRYNVFLNETLGVMGYVGLARSQVIGSVDATDKGLLELQSTVPAVGGGLLFRLGPHWAARVDLGLDMIGTGLMISF